MSEAHHHPKPPEIPDKLYFRIGEVARLLGVETHTLRFWEGEFGQLKVGKGGTGQRLYRRRDVELALRIRNLLYEQGYTIPGARQLLQGEVRRARSAAASPAPTDPPGYTAPPTPAPAPDEPQQAVLKQLRAGLQDLSTMLATTDSPEERTGHNTAGPGIATGRCGLFVATRSGKRGGAGPGNTPGLFGHTSD